MNTDSKRGVLFSFCALWNPSVVLFPDTEDAFHGFQGQRPGKIAGWGTIRRILPSCLPVSMEIPPVFLLIIEGICWGSDLLLTRQGISAAGKAALGNSVEYFHDTVTPC